MMLRLEEFQKSFAKKAKDYGITWESIGFYTPDEKVVPFGTDTKVISTVFESLAGPLVGEIAAEHGYVVEGSEQTIYPDFTLSPKDSKNSRIAINIKTTYRKRPTSKFRYTLGSYASFLRDPKGKKNIRHPYPEYIEHWVVGFLYTRRCGVHAKVYYKRDEAKELLCPYEQVEFFIQEKYKIIGESPASGNTTNIGSFPTESIDALRRGEGPFAPYGKVFCDEYWKHYGKTKGQRGYGNIAQFLEWRKTQGIAVGE